MKDLIIRTRGAKHGRYQIHIAGLYYQITLQQHYETCFVLDLCQDR